MFLSSRNLFIIQNENHSFLDTVISRDAFKEDFMEDFNQLLLSKKGKIIQY